MTSKSFTPNHIPKSTRIFNLVWGIGLIIMATFGWLKGELFLPGKGGGITYTGDALLLFIAAAVFGVINLFITIVDHYDKRDNERYYQKANKICTYIAVALVITASAMQYSNDAPKPVIISNT